MNGQTLQLQWMETGIVRTRDLFGPNRCLIILKDGTILLFISPANSGCFESCVLQRPSSLSTGDQLLLPLIAFPAYRTLNQDVVLLTKSHSHTDNGAELLVMCLWEAGCVNVCSVICVGPYVSVRLCVSCCFSPLAFISTERSGRMASRGDDSILFRQYAPTISQHASESSPWRSQAEAKEPAHAARVTNTKPYKQICVNPQLRWSRQINIRLKSSFSQKRRKKNVLLPFTC